MKASVVEYWRAVEMFSPQNVPKLAPNDSSEPVYLIKSDSVLPWCSTHPLKNRRPPSYTSRRFLVYCGVFKLEKVRSILEVRFGKDPEIFDERSDGETCLFAFSVTDNGYPLFDTFVLSSCAWATARTISPGPNSAHWLNGFESKADEIANDFADRYALLTDDEKGHELKAKGFNLGRPLEYEDIFNETKRIAESLGLGELYEEGEIRVKARLIASKKKYSADDQDFLNSFFVSDLGKVASEVRSGNLGKGLSAFLSGADEIDVSRRVDVRKSAGILFQQLSPSFFPSGRWPSKGHHPLVFSQQFAINSMCQNLMESAGIFSVNGPPGTGKTTLLRDLIAAVIVERAKVLSDFSRPKYAFGDVKRWKVGQYTRSISTWKESLRGFEIVVASNNNGAVENITLEIPGEDAIDPSWLSSSDYFPDIASRLIDQPAWAMMAARLGNKTNRNDFLSKFWYGEKVDGNQGLLDLLKSFESQTIDWEQATKSFKQALADEQNLRNERIGVFKIYLELFTIQKKLSSLEKKIPELELHRRQAGQKISDSKNAEKRYGENVGAAKTRRFEHRQFRPSIIEILLTLGKVFYEWYRKDRVLQKSIDDSEYAFSEAKEQTLSRQQSMRLIEIEIQQIISTMSQYRESLNELRECLETAKVRFGSFFPIPENWGRNENTKELSSPWADPEWNQARAKVFLEALQLHKAFITANADVMRKNLMGAMDILSDAVPSAAPKEAVEAAWTTLFLVVPVISTTFASFPRLFSHLGRESIGWLLIDEAGQAIPQSAAGAIWRSKRSIVVGDPMQLEPVVTIPFTVQKALSKHFQVEDLWMPGNTSVQSLSDRVNRFGTFIPSEDEAVWVGSPLRVHRRCDQPMFDISNRVAYDGLMVFGTPSRPSIPLPTSCWRDVVSVESEGHWIPAEGKVVEELISDLVGLDVQPDDIFLISPFRVVVRQLHLISRKFNGIRSGTVHATQGKESDVVILVLGGDPRRPGAKQWASKRPNLLNVAASRAKRRLFVVGNQETWKKYPYFSECSSILSRYNEGEA